MPGLPGAAPQQSAHDQREGARSLVGKPVRVVEDFLTDHERRKLLRYAKNPKAPWENYLPEGDVWRGRMINPRSMNSNTLALMENIRARVAAHIKADYGIERPVYADTLQLIRWRVGDNQEPHADCEEPDRRPNEMPWRAFASIIYLNDDFEGGEIYWPELGLQPPIKPGMLAYFPSTADYLHGVRAVTKGKRYTFSCFYTFDARHHDGYAV